MSRIIKSFFIIMAPVTIVIVLFSTFTAPDAKSSHRFLASVPDRSRVLVKLADYELEVEVVNSVESVRQGLSNRDQIGADGMLFVLPSSQIHAFWMKDMKFDLDFVWLEKMKVVDVSNNIAYPKLETQKNSPATVSPRADSDMVIELASDWLEAHPLEQWDKLTVISILK